MRRLLFVLLLAACASTGTPIRWDAMRRDLHPGQSTVRDAVAVLGEPYAVRTGPNRSTSYVWTYAKSSAFGGTYAESVRLDFDEQGRLVSLPVPPPNRKSD